MRASACLIGLLLLTVPARAGDSPGPGQVLLDVREADLATEVLPRIAASAGVRFQYEASNHAVSLRLVSPVDWEEALDLVCRFARVHASRTSDGRILIRDGWGGRLGPSDHFADLRGKADLATRDTLGERHRQVEAARAAECADWNRWLRQRWDEWMVLVGSQFLPSGVEGGFSWSGGTNQGVVPQGPRGPTGNTLQGSVPRGPQGPTGNTLQGPQGPTGNTLQGPQGPTGNTLQGAVPRGPQTNPRPATSR